MVEKKFCEVCGRETTFLVPRKIEGVVLNVCSACKELGEEPPEERKKRIRRQSSPYNSFRNSISSSPRPSYRSSYSRPVHSSKPRTPRDDLSMLKVKDDAPQILLKLRTSKGYSSKEFANKLQIKENYYKRIEKGTTALPIELARKIEKMFHIELVEKEEYDEEDDYSQYLKKSRAPTESVIYFKKRGQKPEYD